MRQTRATCGNCGYYIARPPELMRNCTRRGVCIKTASATEPDWNAPLAPCNAYCNLSDVKRPTHWVSADSVSDALQRWVGTFDGHIVLSAAMRYAWDRGTGGSSMTLEAIAKLIPYAGENTAITILRDIEGPYGEYEPDLSEMSREQCGLFLACKEKMGEIDEIC